jgi:hypothetical protein
LCRPVFFSEHFGTLPPEVIFTSVSSDPIFHQSLCFFASVTAFLFAITPPYLGENHASTRGTLSGALMALSLLLSSSSLSLSFDDVVGGGGSSRGRREFKNPKIIPYTEPTIMTKRIKPRSWYGTPRKKDNMNFHTFSDATLFFDDVGAINIIGGVHRRPRCGFGGNIATASVGMRTMTIAHLVSSVACDGHAFALAGRPFACLHGRHRLMIPRGGDGGGAATTMTFMLASSQKAEGDSGKGSRRLSWRQGLWRQRLWRQRQLW